MKLIICTTEYYPYGSGIANVAHKIVEHLKIKGIECVVCSPTGPDIILGNRELILKFGRIGLMYYWYKVSRYFKNKNDYDIAWLHQPIFIIHNPFSISLITVHTTAFGVWRGSSIIKYSFFLRTYYFLSSLIEKHCFRKINIDGLKFTGSCSRVCRELEEIGIDRNRITYIPNGVNTQRFKPSKNKKILREKFGIPEDNLIILSLGRLTKIKQPEKLIEVYSIIEKEMINITLIIAGSGELMSKTKELVNQKKLINVRFLGFVDENDKPDLYACSNFYIMTSISEGLPLTCLEAMSSGLPLIVSKIPVLSELVKESKAGIVVDFNDPRMAANDILNYLKDEQLVKKHGEQARRIMINSYEWKEISNRYLEDFQKLCNYQNYGEIL